MNRAHPGLLRVPDLLRIPNLLRFVVTLAIAAAAATVGWSLWNYYMEAPWTRDGRVRADVIGLTPDVSGLVAEVLVRDNQQVRRGDVLFRVDRARFELALRQAEAVVSARLASFQEASREATRYQSLNQLAVSQEKQQQTESTQGQAGAAYAGALADRDLAKLNLDRSEVTAPLNGRVTNFDMRPGDYVTAGHPVFALLDTDSLHVDGYFEETKLSRIVVGDPVRMRLIGDTQDMQGHVQSIASGIEDRERSSSSNLLANVTPTFSWVRLAQRIPARVELDDKAQASRLIAGRTVTVEVLPRQR